MSQERPRVEPLAASEERSTIEKIVKVWEDRRQSVTGVRCVLKGESLRTAGSLNGLQADFNLPEDQNLPAENHTYDLSYTLSADFNRDWFRLETEEDRFGPEPEWRRVAEIFLFDGARSQKHTPPDLNEVPERYIETELTIEDPPKRTFLFEKRSIWPVFFACGVLPPVTGGHEAPVTFRDVARIEDMQVLGRAVVEDHACVILAPPGDTELPIEHELWITDDMTYRVVRYFMIVEDDIALSLSMEYDSATHPDFPSRIVMAAFDRENLSLREELQTKEIQTNPPLAKSHFYVVPTPGMVVYNRPKGKFLRIQDEGKAPLDAMQEHRRQRAREQSRGSAGVYWGFVALGVVCILMAGYFALRRRAAS
ncbi:MAG: hypothetical protein WBC44_02305 [Planctomycetaceae bacterium]